ncbi:hypothetical protein CN074_32295 [Sinorhizobium medicae]|nr:hypothetical protein CN201_30995 [Sinorhizobium medicae]RVP59224.1 hypothetical protein CN074_32295 [Sinorhizobium medicae]
MASGSSTDETGPPHRIPDSPLIHAENCVDRSSQPQSAQKTGGVKAATMRQASHHRLMRKCAFP